MKRSHDLEDAGDRAQKHRKPGLVRIPLEKIGFWPNNRGGLGVCSHHIHEVAWDCTANKTKLQRYQHVDLIEIPQDQLQHVRDANRERCEGDAFMPCFSSHIQYVCASKTHFVHAQKLAKEGVRSIFNKGDVRIRWQEADTEGAQILEQGPLCAIYGSSLLHDIDATSALASDDNLNAGVQWGEDEMQAFGRVHEMMERLAPSQEGTAATIDVMIASLQVSGLGQFSCEDWKEFIALRSSLSVSIAKVLQTCQFNACAGRVRVRPSDFGLSAKLDPRAPWAKVALMLWQYIGSADQRHINANVKTFSGRREIVAKKMPRAVIQELVAETHFVCSVDTFIKKMLSTYSQPQAHGSSVCVASELLAARGELLANCGRYLLKVGHVLEHAAKKAIAKREAFAPHERIRIIQGETTGKLNKLEDYFRKELLKRKLYAEDALPPAMFPVQVVEAPSQAKTHEVDSTRVSGENAESPQSSGQGARKLAHVAAGALTDTHIFERLRVKGCGEEVMAFVKPDSLTVVKSETPEMSCGLVDASEGSQPSEDAWRIVRLISVSLPQAVVELPVDDGCERIVMCVDELRAVSTVKESQVILHPSLQECGKTLSPYDYESCQLSFSKAIAGHMLLWTHASAIACVERVTVSRLSDQGKLRCILQARALHAFKKGSLILAPAYGELLPKDSDTKLQLARSQGVVHTAMFSHVEVKVVAAIGDRRRTAESREGKETPFVIGSPLLAGKAPRNRDVCMENLAPFWALLRCAGNRASHNMELDTMVFRDPGFETKAGTYPQIPKGVEWTVQMPIARNVCHISKGEVLLLPFLDFLDK